MLSTYLGKRSRSLRVERVSLALMVKRYLQLALLRGGCRLLLLKFDLLLALGRLRLRGNKLGVGRGRLLGLLLHKLPGLIRRVEETLGAEPLVFIDRGLDQRRKL